mgnify:FL=1|jgi:predicted phosphodiesterase
MILVLGDIHGNFNYIKTYINRYKISDCYIIQVGDFGIGFNSYEKDMDILDSFNTFLKNAKIIMYAIRGNHDNPSFFDGSVKFSNLELVPDYTVLKLDEINILLIGGAISIDRKSRILENTSNIRYGIESRCYWITEKIVYNEDFIKDVRNIDVLITHTAPDWCTPDNKFGVGRFVESFADSDSSLISELKEERALMSKIFNELKSNNNITKHFYGHFHRSDTTLMGNCSHILVDINEFVELR